MTQTSRLPRGVIALGFVSLFMDTSSEMVHSLLPVFLVSVLGVGAMSVGIIEGIAEAAAAIVKVFSGTLSDWMGRRKPLVLVGYGLAALTKPLFPLASGLGLVLTARFVYRIGQGHPRGAARCAGCGCRPGRPARHRVRPVQPGNRRDLAAGQLPGGRAVDGGGAGNDLRRRRRVFAAGAGRAGCDQPAGAGCSGLMPGRWMLAPVPPQSLLNSDMPWVCSMVFCAASSASSCMLRRLMASA